MTWRTHDLSQIIEQIPIGVAVTLPSGAIEYVNPHLSAMLRSPPAQLEGVDLGDLRISASPSQNERMRRRLLAGEPWREEAQFVTASGDKLLVNDSLGHDGGDDLLRQVAARMRTCLRDTDTVARLGGDEFGAILDRVLDSEIAAKIADKLLAACCGSYELRGNAVRVTMSVGLSLYPRDGQEADILLKRADLAMYRAKATGRNRSELRDPGRARRYGFT